MCVCAPSSFSCILLFVTPWTVAWQAPLFMGFSRQEYWSAEPFPSPGDLPDPGIKIQSPALQADFLPSESPGKPITIYKCMYVYLKCLYYFFHMSLGKLHTSWLWGTRDPSPSEFLSRRTLSRSLLGPRAWKAPGHAAQRCVPGSLSLHRLPSRPACLAWMQWEDWLRAGPYPPPTLQDLHTS